MSVSRVKLNIAANYASSAWSALATLVFAPVYLRYLGVEAYGLIGTFVILQALLGLLDMGLGPSLHRSMARFTAGVVSPQAIRDLLRSVEWIVAGAAVLIALTVWAASGWLAVNWLKADRLPHGQVSHALAIMGLLLALRLIENIYRAGLLGLQRQLDWSVINIAVVTLRTAGAAGILAFVSPTISAFFQWQAGVAILSVASMRFALYRRIPAGGHHARFSPAALSEIAAFAGGMLGVTFLSLIISQLDKIMLVKMRPLIEYGYYTLAVAAAGAVLVPIGPVNNAVSPRFSELVARGDDSRVISLYHDVARTLNAVVASFAFILCTYAEPLLRLWVGDGEIAAHVAPLLSVYVIATMCNAVAALPVQAQFAYGWTELAFKSAGVALVAVAAALFWAVPRYGALGACWVWAAYNFTYAAIVPAIMHRTILKGEAWDWYVKDVCLPLGLAGVVVMAMRWLAPACGDFATAIYAAVSGFLALAVSLSSVPEVRAQGKVKALAACSWIRRGAAE